MTEPVPALVTLHLWRVPVSRVFAALVQTALDRPALRRTPGARFAKLLGTGRGRTFTPGDADPRRWALLTTWETAAAAAGFAHSGVVRRWNSMSEERWVAALRPLHSRGRWSGREPFGDPSPSPSPSASTGPVAAITRARIAIPKTLTFWRAVPPVASDLHHAGGLRLAMGIGEFPVGLQGTFSLWSSAEALNAFAYGRAAHRVAVRRTAEEGWYAEELFARFAVVTAEGTVDGRDPLG